MGCAQPSVSLLLKSLKSSKREEPWKPSTAVSDHPKPRVAGSLSTGAARTLRPGRPPPGPAHGPGGTAWSVAGGTRPRRPQPKPDLR